jgi:hypothetical protein
MKEYLSGYMKMFALYSNVKQNKTNTKNLLNANNNSRNKGVLFHIRAKLPLFVLVNLDESATRRLLLKLRVFPIAIISDSSIVV